VLWDSLTGRLQQLSGKKVCVCGDFNDVCCDEENAQRDKGPGLLIIFPLISL
ncbi:endonuclease/exonuclease/phosphatase family protein, partial [Trifolium medium]|nr:endonuclease/exonuclease/phosphatase family protein [Trifolium medium]